MDLSIHYSEDEEKGDLCDNSMLGDQDGSVFGDRDILSQMGRFFS